MSNMHNGFFKELPIQTQEIVRDLILKAANERRGPEGFKSDDECLGGIECERRDGFIPFDHNRGGLTYNNFATQMDYYGSGHNPAHKQADKELEQRINRALDEIGTQGLDEDAETEALTEYLSDENSTVMHHFQFLYHGTDDKGLHSASVCAAINLEAPYHRSYIRWAPGVFCEGAHELSIQWKNDAELKRKLDAALRKVSKAVF